MQLTVWPETVQVQPVPLAAVGKSPVGTVSIRVTVPSVGTAPMLVTVMV